MTEHLVGKISKHSLQHFMARRSSVQKPIKSLLRVLDISAGCGSI